MKLRFVVIPAKEMGTYLEEKKYLENTMFLVFWDKSRCCSFGRVYPVFAKEEKGQIIFPTILLASAFENKRKIGTGKLSHIYELCVCITGITFKLELLKIDTSMKKFVLIFFFMVFTAAAFGQQFLWTTLRDSTTKYVPLEDVTEKVLDFYDHYEFYYDGSGYSKDGFFKMFEDSKSFKTSNISRWRELKKKIYAMDSLTVIAFKSNLGQGSLILVMCISKENVNLISFSNIYEKDALFTYSTERQKFSKWFKTLLE